MSAAGASPTYFDFDAFQEINVTTGGGDLTVQTGGLGINLVTKRGTNKFHGGGRYLYAGDGMQSSNLPDALKTDPLDGRVRAHDVREHVARHAHHVADVLHLRLPLRRVDGLGGEHCQHAA